MKVCAKWGKNQLKTDPLSYLALTRDFLDMGKQVDLQDPLVAGGDKVYGAMQTINTTGKWD